MKSKILVDFETYMCSVALLEDGVLKEFYIEDKNTERITGNIYKGKVVNVLPGLASAFVDIGKRKNGFLAASDMLEDRTSLVRSGRIPTRLDVKEGDYVLVQAVKEQTETKGPRLSANLSIPGRYVVYMPTVPFIGVSNKIKDEDTRRRLTELLTDNRPTTGCGLIARTFAKDARPADILDEISYFAGMYEHIVEKFNMTDGVEKLMTDGDLIFRSVRDMLNFNVDEIVCNDAQIAARLTKHLTENLAHPVKVTLDEKTDILKRYGVINEVDKLLHSKVELESGGTLVIDYTEALTVVDVNSAKFIGDTDREETVFAINCEAAKEIARQIRLRNVGGMIIIDFIDMQDPLHNEEVVEVLRQATLGDRTRTRVLPMTELGLVQMTRKKTGTEIQKLLMQPCAYCHGAAKMQSPNFLMRKIKAGLYDIFDDSNVSSAIITVSPVMYEQFTQSDWQLASGKLDGKSIYIIASDGVSVDSYRISAHSSAVLSLPNRAYLLS